MWKCHPISSILLSDWSEWSSWAFKLNNISYREHIPDCVLKVFIFFNSFQSVLILLWDFASNPIPIKLMFWSFLVDVEGFIDSMSNSNCSVSSCFPIIWMGFNQFRILWNWTRMTVFTFGRFRFYTKFSLNKFRVSLRGPRPLNLSKKTGGSPPSPFNVPREKWKLCP